MERAGWMKKGYFHSATAGAVLTFWHELAINGYASMNAIKRLADHQRLRNLIWPEDDR